jgi:hypothetical protein
MIDKPLLQREGCKFKTPLSPLNYIIIIITIKRFWTEEDY